MIRPLRAIVFAAVAAAAVLTARPAFAGPPLLCEPFEIGTARSLPFALLNGRTGVMVRSITAISSKPSGKRNRFSRDRSRRIRNNPALLFQPWDLD